MDELDLLRRVRNDVAAPSSVALLEARGELMDAAAEAANSEVAAGGAAAGGIVGASNSGRGKRVGRRSGQRGAWRPRVRRLMWSGLAAAGVAAAVVSTSVFGLPGHAPTAGGGTSIHGIQAASAAEVLNRAADAAITSTDPVVQPGQYLKIVQRSEELNTVEKGAYVLRYRTTYYVPTDRREKWVAERGRATVVKYYDASNAAKTEAREYLKAYNSAPSVERAKDGAFKWFFPYGRDPWTKSSAIEAYPRDPHKLLALYESRGHHESLSEKRSAAFDGMRFTLASGLVPADLRATFYRAMAMIPGVEIVDGRANLDGRKGVSFARESDDADDRGEIIVDPKTGEVLGERDVVLSKVYGLPVGTVMQSSSIQTSVADSAPRE